VISDHKAQRDIILIRNGPLIKWQYQMDKLKGF
jgi:hypothetical protein